MTPYNNDTNQAELKDCSSTNTYPACSSFPQFLFQVSAGGIFTASCLRQLRTSKFRFESFHGQTELAGGIVVRPLAGQSVELVGLPSPNHVRTQTLGLGRERLVVTHHPTAARLKLQACAFAEFGWGGPSG